MYRIAVIGDADSVFGYAALGLDVFPEEDTEKAVRTLHRLAGEGYAVIFITERLAAQVDEAIQSYASQQLPAVILIPGVSGNTGQGIAALKRSVEQAVGSDIIFNDENE